MNTHPWRPLLRRILPPSLTSPFRRLVAVVAASVTLLTQNTAHAYTHPCMPLTAADLATLNANKNTGQWATGYAALNAEWRAQLSYGQQGPFVEVGRNANTNLNQWRNDMVAIWALAMRWKFTGDSAYAEKAKGILLSWATTHTTWTGVEPYLEMGDYMKFFGTGASILRSYSGWTTANTSTVKNYMANIHYPVTTVDIPLRSANQGGAHLEGAMGVAVYNDDTNLFNRVLLAYRTNSCTGLRNTLSNGQIGDSGREPGHARVELLHYAWISEVALKAAGVDLFAESGNRLRAAGEYYANWNSGGNPAFIKSGTCYFDIYVENSAHNPGRRDAIVGPDFLHILHSAYVVRKGLTMPYLTTYRANQTDNFFTWVFRKAADSTTGTSLPGVVTPTTMATTSVNDLIRVDIGGALPAGTVGFSGGTWTVSSSGLDIWSTANDNFTYVYKPLVGDAAMIARVTSVGSAPAPMAGLVFRDSLAANARMSMIVNFKGTGGTTIGVDGLGMSTRGATHNSHYTAWRYHPMGGVPYWVKVERLGNQVTTFSSPDGTNWSPSHTAWYTDLPSTCYLGLAVASRADGNATTATFTNVSITGAGGGGGFPPAGNYSLRNRGNGLMLDSYGRTANGSNCAMHADSTHVNQNWTLSYVSSNVVKLQAHGGGLYLDGMGRTTNGSICGLWPNGGSNNQRWTIVDAGGGYYKLVNVATGLCPDVGAAPWANGDNMEQWPNGGSYNTQWEFVAP